jgi:hypothetical protein
MAKLEKVNNEVFGCLCMMSSGGVFVHPDLSWAVSYTAAVPTLQKLQGDAAAQIGGVDPVDIIIIAETWRSKGCLTVLRTEADATAFFEAQLDAPFVIAISELPAYLCSSLVLSTVFVLSLQVSSSWRSRRMHTNASLSECLELLVLQV